MDPTIIAALIGGGATVVAALIAVRASRNGRPQPPDPSTTDGPPRRPRSPSAPHQGVTDFWLQYQQLAQTEFPALSLVEPRPRPANSDWPQFTNDVGRGRYLIHKWSEGFVDLTVEGTAQAVDDLRARNRAILSSDMEVVRTTQSASFRLTVPKIDRFGDFAKQRAAVRAGLAAVVRLLALAPRIQA